MANIAKTYTFVNGQPADATQVNKNFDDIITGVGDISAAGHALIDDADATAQLATLGTAAYSEGTWTPTLNGFTVVGSAPSASATYKRIGNLMFITCTIYAGSGGNTSVAGSLVTSNITGQPTTVVGAAPIMVTDGSAKNLGIGMTGDNGTTTLYVPTFAATPNNIIIAATFNV